MARKKKKTIYHLAVRWADLPGQTEIYLFDNPENLMLVIWRVMFADEQYFEWFNESHDTPMSLAYEVIDDE